MMRLRSLLVVACAPFALGLLATACASNAAGARVAGDPTRPIPLAEWCAAAGKQMCGQMGERCMGGGAFADGFTSGCEGSFVPSCTAGRDPGAASGRTAAELNSCLATLETTACDQIMSQEALAACQVGPL